MSQNNENVSFMAALWRFVSFYRLRKALGLVRAADAQFTKSASGIADAYDIHHERLVGEFREFVSALSGVEVAVEQKRQRLAEIRKAKGENERALEGALAAYEAAEKATNAAAMDEAQRDGTAFRADAKRYAEQEAQVEADIRDQEAQLTQLETRLADMQREIAKLPAEKAAAIADFVSNQKLIEANERLMGLKSRVDASPLDAVQKANADLAARAKATGKLAGIDHNDKMRKYQKAGDEATADADFKALLAARKAKATEATGAGPAVVEERKKI